MTDEEPTKPKTVQPVNATSRTLRRTTFEWADIEFGTDEALANEVRDAFVEMTAGYRQDIFDFVQKERELLALHTELIDGIRREHGDEVEAIWADHETARSKLEKELDAVRKRADESEKARQEAHVAHLQCQGQLGKTEGIVADKQGTISKLTVELDEKARRITALGERVGDLIAELDEASRHHASECDLMQSQIRTLTKSFESANHLLSAQSVTLEFHAWQASRVAQMPRIPGIMFSTDGELVDPNTDHVIDIGGNKTIKVLDSDGCEVFKTKEVPELVEYLRRW